MQTKLGAFAGKIVESGWLAAIVVVPLLFNLYTERIFEEDKIPLLRSIALVVAVALLVWAVERGREAWQIEGRPFWKLPIVPPALLLTAAYLLSTLFSIMPRVSFWGAYIRRQGTYSWLSYVVLFLGILFLVRRRQQVERILTLVLVSSVPASLYAFLQNRGLDPIPWGGDVVTRVSSTAGNPIFISAFLIMVIPLTLMRVIEHFQKLLQHVPEGEEPPSYLASSLLAGAYLFLLIIQLITLLYSQSRGPLLGLGVGLVFFGILFSLRYSRWLTLSITGLAVAGIAFLILINLPSSPLAPLREVRYIGRLGQVFDTEDGTGRVRVLIWDGASRLLASDPSRLLLGRGPETMYVAFNPFYPPELAQIEKRNASPDRSHNETFDSLVMTGVLGFVAQTVLFLSIFFYVLKWLGLIDSPGQRNAFLATAGAGALIGGLLPYLLEGSFRMAGVGLPAGIASGLIVYLLLYALTHLKPRTAAPHPHHLLLAALVSAIIGHFVEIHFGIAIAATRLYFWIFAGLIIVIGLPLVRAEEEPIALPVETATKRRGRRVERVGHPSPFSSTLVGLSLLMSLILGVLTFDFFVPNVGLDLGKLGLPLLWLFLGSWLFGALAVTAESAVEQGEARRWPQRLGAYALVSLGCWLLFCLFFIPWASTRPETGSTITVDDLLGFGTHVANIVTLVYLFTFAIMALSAWIFLREEPSLPHVALRPPRWQAALYGVALLALVPAITLTNLNISRADVLSKQGTGYERNRNWDAARVLYEEALRLQPDEDRYFLNLGRALLEKARTVRDTPAQRDPYLEEARAILEEAQATNPLNTDHTRNLANLHRAWAALLDDPSAAAEQREIARGYYERATALSPNNAALWNEWATLFLEQKDYAGARARLNQSLTLDDEFVMTYLLLGNLEIEAEAYESSIAAFDQALALSPESLPALSGKALALSRLDRTGEAIQVNQQALQVAPNDYTTLKNLALLYRNSGEYEEALQSAQAALAVARPEDRASMESFIRELTAQQASDDSGG